MQTKKAKILNELTQCQELIFSDKMPFTWYFKVCVISGFKNIDP